MIIKPNKLQPMVSIIMNCYNGSEFLREAIDSVYSQKYQNWEIIFWDNGSTDNSAEIAQSYDDRIRYYYSSIRVPLYCSRNDALKKANGEYIAFLDCDDLWLPRKLELQVKHFMNNQNAGFLYSNFEIITEDGTVTKGYKTPKQPEGRIFKDLLKHYRICVQSVLVSKKALLSLEHQFDNNLEIAGDADLFLRLSSKYEALYIEEVTTRYRVHSNNISIRKALLLPHEAEYIIFKLVRSDYSILTLYENEISAFMRRIHKGVVVSKWRSGDSLAARKILLKHLRSSGYLLCLYPLSFLSYKKLLMSRNTLQKYILKMHFIFYKFKGRCS